MKDRMTWEETILSIRRNEDFKDLVEKAYFDDDLELNIDRFAKSDEFRETLKIIDKYASNASTLLDIGCGNGISSINFALNGYIVTAVEPDSSNTVGAGAIKKLKKEYNLKNLDVFEQFAEDINFESNVFDIVYIRQAMHHAHHLEKFVKECIRVLKPNGLLLTIRDHVIFDKKDKEWFIETHPLQKYYGGENAFTSTEYKNAIINAGAKVIKELKFYDSIINYYPLSKQELNDLKKQNVSLQKRKLVNKLGGIGNNRLVWNLYRILSNYNPLNEGTVPGRMYSYIAIKK